MAIRHMAWLKFKDGVTEDQIDRHMVACRGLAKQVPALDRLECGASFTDRSGGFTHGIIVSVSSQAALTEYLNHTAHVPAAEALVSDVAELRVMDIEF